jgi:DNA-binding CsgD family transcriptional regulator
MSRGRRPEIGDRGSSNSEILRPRIAQTLGLLLDGGSEKEMAAQMGVTHHTVHVYMKTIYRHFGVCTRAELMALILKALLRSVTKTSALDDPAISAALKRVSPDPRFHWDLAAAPTNNFDREASRRRDVTMRVSGGAGEPPSSPQQTVSSPLSDASVGHSPNRQIHVE